MDRSVNSAPRTGIQFARNIQIFIFITGGIVLTQADVRKIQLAVAAIKSGVRMILDEAGLGVSDLDGIFVAGARKLLLSGPERRTIESYARKIKHIPLASGRAFQDRFITALELKPYSGGSA